MPSDLNVVDDFSLPCDASMASCGNASFRSDDEEGHSGTHSASRSDGGRSSTDSNVAETLVKQENRTVNVSRIVVILILIGAMIATAYFVFRFTREGEVEAYDDAFHNVAGKLTSAMVSDTSLKFWMARTISDATAMMLKTTNSTAINLFIPQEDWDNISRESRFHGNANMVSWNPLLKTDSERIIFEEFTKTKTFTVGTEPECFVCGDERRAYSNVNHLVDIPGFGIFPCGLLENTGRQGVIPAGNCAFITNVGLNQGCNCIDLDPSVEVLTNEVDIPEHLWKMDPNIDMPVEEPYNNAPYLPIWTTAVLEVVKLPVMYNQMSDPITKRSVDAMLESTLPVISETFYREGAYYRDYAAYPSETSTILQFPVFLDDNIVGTVSLEVRWSNFVSFTFPPLANLVDIVIENSCGQNFTFTVDPVSDTMILIGEGDLHDRKFDASHSYSSTFEDYDDVVTGASATLPPEGMELSYCRYRFHVFGTEKFQDEYITSQPMIFAIITASVFLFTSIVFIVYDMAVTRRQQKITERANQTSAIVSSLFPTNIRDRLYNEAGKSKKKGDMTMRVSKLRMQSFLSEDNNDASEIASEPIADLFPMATVMFLDIAGFTAWSSEREPSQVFKLLEGVYQAFDKVAKKMQVFKVETIGDSYVAVCGLPTHRDGHAPVMVRFASSCLKAMARVTRELEVFLGPSTGDLRARVGLHSGPVTAGVLRGEKARFQLFGDTVNTASRIESTGMPGKIHASKNTVDLLIEAGKGHWATKREELVSLKGKGEVQTFWVSPHFFASQTQSTLSETSASSPTSLPTSHTDKSSKHETLRQRLVEWNVEVLNVHLEQVVIGRGKKAGPSNPRAMAELEEAILEGRHDQDVIDEMCEILPMPTFKQVQSSTASKVSPLVKAQLRAFVERISLMYGSSEEIPFHNFEHVSHVVMSASKLMNRIVNPDGIDYKQDSESVALQIHNSTYGISSDPLLRFAAVFSALIHDCKHTGLTNAELVALGTPEAIRYHNKTVAEQNSVDLAWKILMESKFKDLRACIYSNEEELLHFHKLMVNAVMATDIADKDLKAYRENRWELAFKDKAEKNLDSMDRDRKATIVFEYIIQASDVAHTMQHWATYQKFNCRLFEERYIAWLNGHMEKEPSLGWYGGEIWFFDNYIIPLAKKLYKCGVFGVSYHEFLNYANENRKEWEMKGEAIVAKMKSDCDAKYAKQLALKMNEQHDATAQ
ncbi:adenylate/guanylate cyclase [Nitzschia inconspicua]|uniref:Adenylate/guanylate cyclase n=1 Tax=Nitzschia inconspicua TaxID=303405 RepID=A0A9K3LD55_9STRA|nr:adenylate/guanylate cyclase [Nitzschia inconspicua]